MHQNNWNIKQLAKWLLKGGDEYAPWTWTETQYKALRHIAGLDDNPRFLLDEEK